MNPAEIDGLDSVKASYKTSFGLVKSSWKKQKDQFGWQITVPANSKAIVYLPAENIADIEESGKSLSGTNGIRYLRRENGRVVVKIGSGDYIFQINNPLTKTKYEN
ncbi:bacterial alpha-L-rhamnosidase [mine drainage metagenome]|uniref:Bacterial alpha-L-rhamnosidase n=1 Tax=mine drainage metagenome TaxID=410659 RepID=A0A1J5P172_9ZZZZ